MVVILAALSGLFGCAPQPEDCRRSDIHCAALVTDFGSAQVGASGQAWRALQDARADHLLDRADYIETVDARDRAANIASFGDKAYDIVVTVGTSIADETAAAARRYPDVTFVGVQQPQNASLKLPNYAILLFHEEASGFLAGAAAGLLTSTGRVSAICEAEFIESIHKYCEGFRIGAEHVNPAIDAQVIYRSGSQELLFRDVDWGKTAALREVDAGSDVIFAAGQDTAQAALLAAAGRAVHVIGAETDQYSELPSIRPQLATSAILDIRSGVMSLLTEILERHFPEGPHWGNVGLAPFHDFEDRMSPEVTAQLREIMGDLGTGALRVDVPDQ